MKKLKLLAPVICLTILNCSSSIPPPNGMVDWYLSNGSGNSITLVVYDKICKRTYFRIPLSRSGEVPMSTCANSEGGAEFRYRRAGYDTGDSTWTDENLAANQSLLVRF